MAELVPPLEQIGVSFPHSSEGISPLAVGAQCQVQTPCSPLPTWLPPLAPPVPGSSGFLEGPSWPSARLFQVLTSHSQSFPSNSEDLSLPLGGSRRQASNSVRRGSHGHVTAPLHLQARVQAPRCSDDRAFRAHLLSAGPRRLCFLSANSLLGPTTSRILKEEDAVPAPEALCPQGRGTA